MPSGMNRTCRPAIPMQRSQQLDCVAQLVRIEQLDCVAQLVRIEQLDCVAQLVRIEQLDCVAQLVRIEQLDCVAQLVRALHQNYMAAGSIPARGLIIAFLATAPD